ncbi:MAG: hypothetical protein SF052_26645 [Bacteroidia bacterium]|nr:hypothetical protein [Bacteroidia bacterium]
MRISGLSTLLGYMIAIFMPAQSLSGQSLSDSVAAIYKQYFILQAEKTALEDSLNKVKTNFKNVQNQITGLNTDLSSSLQQVNKLTESDLLSKESRLKTKKEKIVTTARFIRAATHSFDAIDAALAQSEYLNDVGLLNSPTNEELGFSLNTEIIQLIDQQIIKSNTKFNDRNPTKFLEIVKTIVESPITTALTSSVPALSSISAVVDLVSSTIVKEKDVSVEDFKKFKESLGKYINHYEALARASYDFNSNLDKLKVKTEALRTLMGTFTVDRVNTLYPETISNGPTTIPINDLISKHYRPEELDNQINKIIEVHKDRRGNLDYQKALNEPRLNYPLYAANQAQFIQQELESVSNEYISTYKLYHSRLMEILDKSKTLSKNTAKVDQKRTELDEKLKRLIQTFHNNVKISEVNLTLQQIPNY